VISQSLKNEIYFWFQLTREQGIFMTDLTQVSQAISEVAPDSVAAQAVEAAVSTAADPSPVKIVEDLMLAHSLWAEFKSKLDGLHPSVASIFKALF
jgi:hypothetical protein